MDPALKLLFTAAIVLAGIVVCFIDFQADNAGPDSFWRFGRRDPVRRLICRGDGSFRRYTKLGLLLWFAVFAAIAKLCFATCCQHSQRELLTEVRNLHPRCRSGASGICGPKQSLGPRANLGPLPIHSLGTHSQPARQPNLRRKSPAPQGEGAAGVGEEGVVRANLAVAHFQDLVDEPVGGMHQDFSRGVQFLRR